MSESEQLAEALAADLAALCSRHKLSLFFEASAEGDIYHLLGQQNALARILADWRPSPVMH